MVRLFGPSLVLLGVLLAVALFAGAIWAGYSILMLIDDGSLSREEIAQEYVENCVEAIDGADTEWCECLLSVAEAEFDPDMDYREQVNDLSNIVSAEQVRDACGFPWKMPDWMPPTPDPEAKAAFVEECLAQGIGHPEWCRCAFTALEDEYGEDPMSRLAGEDVDVWGPVMEERCGLP